MSPFLTSPVPSGCHPSLLLNQPQRSAWGSPANCTNISPHPVLQCHTSGNGDTPTSLGSIPARWDAALCPHPRAVAVPWRWGSIWGLFCWLWHRVRPACCPLVERSQLQGSGSKPGGGEQRGVRCAWSKWSVSALLPSPSIRFRQTFGVKIVRVCRFPGISCSTVLGTELLPGLQAASAFVPYSGGPSVPTLMAEWGRAVGHSSVPGGPPLNRGASR